MPRANNLILIRGGDLNLRSRYLGNIPVPYKEFSDKDCALSSSHLGVVGYQNIFDAVFQDVVFSDSAHRGDHAILSITVQPRLRSEWVLVDHYHMLGG